MALLAGSAIVGGLSSGFQMFQGAQQKKAGEKELSKITTPTYQIPQELYDSLSDAEKKQVEGLPPEQKAEFVKNIERSQASSLKASADRKGGLLGIQASASAETDAFNNLMQIDAAARKESEMNKQAAIERARGNIAGAKDKQFDVANQRYQDQLSSAQANIGAGQQNIMGGIMGLGETALGVAGMAYKPKTGQ